jgi:hypothetical protein
MLRFITAVNPRTARPFAFRTFAASSSDSEPETESKSKKASKPDYLYGVNPVMASLSAERRKFSKLYLNISEKPGAGGER